MAFSTPYTFGFAAAVCITCSLAVATAAQGLRSFQDVNERRDLQGSILTALGLDGLKGEAIDTAYAEKVRVQYVNGAGELLPDATEADARAWLAGDLALKLGETGGLPAEEMAAYRAEAILPVYTRVENGTVQSYAIPVQGVGLWGPISGFIALDPDGHTVTGATFFAPKETPGLGYEIVAPHFREQFVGKQVFDSAGELAPISVVKGEVGLKCPGRTDHCVQGISGATLTGDGVDAMLAGALTAYEPYLETIRSGGNG